MNAQPAVAPAFHRQSSRRSRVAGSIRLVARNVVARERLRKPAADTPSPSKQQRGGKLAERGWQRQFEDPISVAPAAGMALRCSLGERSALMPPSFQTCPGGLSPEGRWSYCQRPIDRSGMPDFAAVSPRPSARRPKGATRASFARCCLAGALNGPASADFILSGRATAARQ
jgi:hypothetical protein